MVKTDEAILNNIVTDYYVFGKSQATIADEQGVGATTVLGIVRAFDAVRNEDWDKCIQLYNAGVSAYFLQWSAKRLDKKLPEKVENTLSEKKRKEAAANNSKSKENENVYFIRVLEELMKQNELMQQLIDVVIPKYTEDTRVAIMKNAVVLCNKL